MERRNIGDRNNSRGVYRERGNSHKNSGIKRMLRIILILEIICCMELLVLIKAFANSDDMLSADSNKLESYDATKVHGDILVGNLLENLLVKGENIIEMTGISQAGIPTGCESVSTVMVLQHMGIDISPETFIDNYLPCQKFYRVGDALFGPDPQEFFAGNPYEKSSLGCFPKVILKALDNMAQCKYSGMKDVVYTDVSGMPLDEIVAEYIAKDIPVLVWVTMDMKESYEGMQYYLEDGSLYTWRANEHCMVLCGYDESTYYLMDPLANGEMVGFEKAVVEMRYEEMGRYAVVVEK